MDASALPALTRPETLIYFLLFIVPGWVMVEVYDRLVPAERRDFGSELVRLVSLSLLDFLLVYAALSLFGAQENFGLLVALSIFIVPPLFAYGYYRLRSSSLLSRDVVPQSPTAFDHVFGKRRNLVVRFKEQDGSVRVGFFGELSHAAPFPGPQQLYLEDLLDVDAEGYPVGFPEPRRGVIIDVANHEILEVFPADLDVGPQEEEDDGDSREGGENADAQDDNAQR